MVVAQWPTLYSEDKARTDFSKPVVAGELAESIIRSRVLLIAEVSSQIVRRNVETTVSTESMPGKLVTERA